ncbi:MAG TPA: DUF6350 family protein [Mycobacteriales bacterium]|nr:DUF6350 family protein [Mycobacteriales bacterium]
MTSTAAPTVPTRRSRGTSAAVPPRPVGLVPATVTAACTAAALGLLAAETLVLLAWASDGRSALPALPAAKAGLLAWLISHGATVSLPDGTLSVAPLGLTALVALLLTRAGSSVVRQTRPAGPVAAVAAGAALGIPYAVVAVLVTGPAALGGARPAPVATLLAALLLGSAFGAIGAARETGLARVLSLLPHTARAVGSAAGVALLVLVATGAVAAGGSLLAHGGRAGDLTGDLDVGLVGGLMLVVGGLAFLPTAVLWGAAYALGTGFALGVGTSVAPTGVRLGPVPVFPLFAALPGVGRAPMVSWLLLAGPILAGMLAGLVVVRRLGPRSPRSLALHALAVGPAAGVVTVLACVLVSGGIGPGRLAVAGPSPWLTGLAAAEWVGLVGAATAYLVARRGATSPSPRPFS